MPKHNIKPVFNENSKILILGSFPSEKSREIGFFYGHKQNRFWRVLSSIIEEDAPEDTEGRRQFLLRHGIALWDVIESCSIVGSSDSSIKDVKPNDLTTILSKSDIKQIFVNGKTAEKYYNKFSFPISRRVAVYLPSTSPSNARMSLDALVSEWKIIKSFLK